MREDEYLRLIGQLKQDVNPKRWDYINKKWLKKGWLQQRSGNSFYTNEFFRIRELAVNKSKMMQDLDHHLVKLVFWYKIGEMVVPANVGIIVDHGDNGWSFHTTNSLKRRYFDGWSISKERVAYVEQHPAPAKLWERMNRLAWQKFGNEDRFHLRSCSSYDKTCLAMCQCKSIN